METITLEEQEKIVKSAWVGLKAYLRKYNLSMTPTLGDPECKAFYDDPSATAALGMHRRAYSKLL